MPTASADTRLDLPASLNEAKALLQQAWAADSTAAVLPFPRVRLLNPGASVDLACSPKAPHRQPVPLAGYCAANDEVLVDQDLMGIATQDASSGKARAVAAYWIATALAERLLAASVVAPSPKPLKTLQANCLAGTLLGAKASQFSSSETEALFAAARAAYGDSAREVVGSASQRGYAFLSGLGATASDCSSADMAALVNGKVPDPGLLIQIGQLPPPARAYSSLMGAINSQCQPLPKRPCPRRIPASKP